MKKIIFIILLLCSIGVLIFTYNNDFLYSKPIMKITNIKVIDKDIEINSLGFKEKHYKKEIKGIITNGKEKGKKKTIIYEDTYSSVVTDTYKINDKIILDGTDTELKRDFYLVLMVVIFINLIYIVGSFKGLLSILSVILNLIIFYIGLSLYFKGINLLLISIIEMIIFAILSLIFAGGINKKTLSAIISVTISIFTMLVLLLITIKFTNFKGVNLSELSYLTVPVKDIILPELLIGTIGAIMDVSITISSSISELIMKDKAISIKALKKSAKEIGKDIMSTMSNVLFFTYLCAGLPIFVLALRNGFTMHNFITSNFTLEITRFLSGSIGIIMAIPISSVVSIYIMKRGVK